MPRLFVAIPLADTLKQKVVRRHVAARGCRWISAPNLHVTLQFVGNATDDMMQSLIAGLGDLQAEPPRCRVTGLIALPVRGSARVLALEIVSNPELLDLQRAVGQVLSLHGVGLDGRSYRPHATIARLRDVNRAWLDSFVSSQSSSFDDVFVAEEIALYRSDTRPDGAVYTIVQKYCLGQN